MNFKQSSTKTTVQVLDEFIPIVIISKDALAKMQLYCDICDTEIGWLGTATWEDDFTIYIDNVFLFKQDVHFTTTEISPEGLAEFAEELLQQDDGLDIWNNVRVWGHSHVNMSVTPSSQDNDQMVTFAEGGHDWFIRIIANKKGDIAIDLYNYAQGIIYHNLPWWEEQSQEELEVIAKINELQAYLNSINANHIDIYKEPITKEIKNKVTQKQYNGRINNNYLKFDEIYDNTFLFSNRADDGTIKNAYDVFDHFDEKLQKEIYKCNSYHQAKAFISSMYEEYTADEIWIIWNAINNKFYGKGAVSL